MTLPIDTVWVRHGESEGNAAKREKVETPELLGRHTSSLRLTNKGRRQARQAGAWLQSEFYDGSFGFDRCFVSEFTRAMETAGGLALPGARWFAQPNLTERDWGDLGLYTEQEREDLFAKNLRMRDVEPFFWTPPNGENFLKVTGRADRVLGTLHRECSDKRVILVCHGEFMWAARVAMERVSQHRFRELHLSDDPDHKIHNCQIIHYTRRNPETGQLAKHANWRRMIRPTDNPVRVFPWEEISRPSYTNEELLELVSRTPAMIS